MDDLAETVLLNMMRGAGLDGLSPLVNDPTKPLVRARRSDVAALVVERVVWRPVTTSRTTTSPFAAIACATS